MMNKLKVPFIFILISVLTGCLEGNTNTNDLCSDEPGLRCDKLNMNDGQCRVARTDLIWHRKKVLKDPSDHNKIEEYSFVQAYQRCLDLAAQIEPLKGSNNKQKRVDALLHSYEEEKRIISELGQSQSPEALYFLWTQGDERAIRKFVAFEGSGKLQTADLQFKLASYYIGQDKEKTLTLLNNALQLSKYKTLDKGILESLTSLNHTLKLREHAYIWAIVAKEFEVNISQTNLTALYPFTAEKKAKLEAIADQIIDAIKDNKFRPQLLPKIEELA